MSRFKLIAIILLVVLALVFIAQNTTPVEATFLFASQSVSLSVLLLIAIGVGFLIGLLTALYMAAKRHKKSAD